MTIKAASDEVSVINTPRSAALASESKSSVTDVSVMRVNNNTQKLYGRLDATLVGYDTLDKKNKELVAVTKDFHILL